MRKHIIRDQAQNMEVHGLEVKFLEMGNLMVFQAMMAQPNQGIQPASIREDAEVML